MRLPYSPFPLKRRLHSHSAVVASEDFESSAIPSEFENSWRLKLRISHRGTWLEVLIHIELRWVRGIRSITLTIRRKSLRDGRSSSCYEEQFSSARVRR